MKRIPIGIIILILLFAGTAMAGPWWFGGGGSAVIDDTKGNGDTAYTWSADKIFDQLALKAPTASPTFTGIANVGTTAAGGNLNVVATLGSELITAPMVTGGWTMTDGWSITAGVLTREGGTTTGTATAVTGMTSAPTAGVTYKVTIVCSAIGGTALTYTLGGMTGTTITATTITDYITASTTAKLIFSGGATATATITSVSVQALTDATGDLTVDGNIVARSQILANGLSNPGYPEYSFNGAPSIGLYKFGTAVGITSDGTRAIEAVSGGVNFGGGNVFLYYAAQKLTQRNSTSQQILEIYNTYTNASNYERLTLTGVQGASVNITAESAGTGSANLDVVLTPKGTGTVKAGAYTVLNTNTGAPAFTSGNANYFWATPNGSSGVPSLRAVVDADLPRSSIAPMAAASGTNTITADFTPDISLTAGQAVRVVSAGANSSTTPTFAPDGLTAHTIVKQGGQALVAGDIGPAGFVAILQYDLTNTRWELLNPVYDPGRTGCTPGSGDCKTGAEKNTVTPVCPTGSGNGYTVWDTNGLPYNCNDASATPIQLAYANADTTGLTAANVPAPTTIVGSGSISVTTKNTYVICTTTCAVTLPVAAAGIQACVRNAPGSATVITLVNRASQYYELTTHAAWATANQKLVSGGVATDSICVVGYDGTHYATMSNTGTWTDTAP